MVASAKYERAQETGSECKARAQGVMGRRKIASPSFSASPIFFPLLYNASDWERGQNKTTFGKMGAIVNLFTVQSLGNIFKYIPLYLPRSPWLRRGVNMKLNEILRGLKRG